MAARMKAGSPRSVRGRRHFVHVRREAVANAVVGLDHPRLFCIVSERRAHVANQDRKVGVGDKRVRPHALDERILADDFWAFFEEHQQQVECLARQRCSAPSRRIRRRSQSISHAPMRRIMQGGLTGKIVSPGCP